MDFGNAAETVGQAVDGAGIVIILIGIILVTIRFLTSNRKYHEYRQGIGKALLLGLEFLVAGDIIRTVAVRPTLESVTVLAVIVVIRTFLSWSLEVELRGRWPWQRHEEKEEAPTS